MTTIVNRLREGIEENVDLSDDVELSSSEMMLLQHCSTVMPWLWNASRIGLQSEFVQNAVCSSCSRLMETSLWLLYKYRLCYDLHDIRNEIDDEVLGLIQENNGMEVLEVTLLLHG